MKKILLILISFTLLAGCSLGNTPTSRVEEYLTKYQMLNQDIDINYTNLTPDTNLNQNIKEDYEEVIKKQYKNLSYEVKDETIDGDTAIVSVQIEVMNYKQAINKYDQSEYESTKYHELVLDELNNTKEMITYTINFTLTKQKNETWVIDPLNEEIKEKLLGIN